MAVLPAWLVNRALSGITSLGYNPSIDIEFVATGDAPLDTHTPLVWYAVTSQLPVSMSPRSLSGSKIGAWFDDYYYRIHISPSAVDVGSTTAYQEREVAVWNAYLEPKTLAGITETGDTDGLSLVGPGAPPTVFAGTEERTYTFSVSTEGPPNIDASYTFDFPAANAATLSVIGSRVTMWPFIPRTGWSESLAWKTDIIPAFGKEQRLAIRTAPRQSLAFQHHLNPREFSRAKALATDWAHRVFGVPVWGERTKIVSLASGSSFIPFSTAYADYRDGGLVALWESNESVEAAEIDTVAPNGLNLKRPLTRDFTNVLVAPVRFCRAFSGFDFSRGTSVSNDLALEFDATDNVALPADPSVTYRGYPVLDYCPLIVTPLDERISRAIDVFDNEQGRRDVEVKSNRASRRYTVAMRKGSRAAVWSIRQWLHSRRGRQKAFWLPSFNRDAVLAQPTDVNPATLTINHLGVGRFYHSTLDLLIWLANGTKHYVQVVDSAVDVNGNEVLVLSAAITSPSIAPADVRQISIMSLVRLDADTVKIGYDAAGYATMTVPAIGVPDL